MICAWIRLSDGDVENIIVADPAVDVTPEGYAIKPVPDGTPVDIDWTWTAEGGFAAPPAAATSEAP